MAQQGGFVRGQVEQRRALARSRCFVSACSIAPLSVHPGRRGAVRKGIVQRTAQSVAPTPAQPEPAGSHMHGTETIAEAGPYPYTSPMTATLIGYARCSTDRQDPAAQRRALLALGVVEDRIYTGHGLAGTTRARPGPRPGPLRPGDPMGKLFFNILATFAEFETDLIRRRTREGMAIARAKGKLRGKQPKLSDRPQRELRRRHATGEYSISDLAELCSVSRPTVYRTLNRPHSP